MSRNKEISSEGLIRLEYFFTKHGWEATKNHYDLPSEILKYWLSKIGFKIWKSTIDNTKCFYREDPTATIWYGRNNYENEFGNSTEQGRNEYYQFRLARIRERKKNDPNELCNKEYV